MSRSTRGIQEATWESIHDPLADIQDGLWHCRWAQPGARDGAHRRRHHAAMVPGVRRVRAAGAGPRGMSDAEQRLDWDDNTPTMYAVVHANATNNLEGSGADIPRRGRSQRRRRWRPPDHGCAHLFASTLGFARSRLAGEHGSTTKNPTSTACRTPACRGARSKSSFHVLRRGAVVQPRETRLHAGRRGVVDLCSQTLSAVLPHTFFGHAQTTGP